MKLAAMKLLGNKCARCELTGPACLFDFHHNQGDKDFNVSSPANKKWSLVKLELEKCELLCANCHRLKHSVEDPAFTIEIYNYTGNLDFKP